MKRAVIGLLVGCAALACLAAPALAADAYPGMEHLHFAAGPYRITPGRQPHPAGHQPRAQARPGRLRCPDGAQPPLRQARRQVLRRHPPRRRHPSAPRRVAEQRRRPARARATAYGGLYPFMASGEEKTVYEFPHGYGYPVGASDTWILNYMIHNLTSKAAQVYITYDIDFVPATSPAAAADHPGASDLDGRRGPPHLPRVRRPPPQRGRREVHLPRHGQAPLSGPGPPLNEFTVDHPGHARRHRRAPAPRRPLRRPRPHPSRHQAGARDDRPARCPTRSACFAPARTTSTSAARSRGTWR